VRNSQLEIMENKKIVMFAIDPQMEFLTMLKRKLKNSEKKEMK